MMFYGRRLKMNRFTFSAFFVAAVLAGSFQIAKAQTVNATVQNASPRVVASRSAPATAAKPGARVAPRVVARPTGLPPQTFNANAPRTIAQPPAYLQRTYSPTVRSVNPGPAILNTQRGGSVQQPISLDPAIRQTETRTLAAMRQRRGIVTRDGNILDPATRQNEIHTLSGMHGRRSVITGQANTLDSATREAESRTLQKMRENRGFGTDNRTLATIDPQRHITNRNPEAGPQGEKPEAPKDAHGKKWRHKKDHISHACAELTVPNRAANVRATEAT